MSVRRVALADIGGFHSDNHDDMDMCHRLMHQRPAEQIVYEPLARVQHFVPSARTTWGYFWRRCFFVNKGKVEAFRQMGGASNLSADVGFVGQAIVPWRLQRTAPGRPGGTSGARCGPQSILAGIGLAGAGHVAGQATMACGSDATAAPSSRRPTCSAFVMGDTQSRARLVAL